MIITVFWPMFQTSGLCCPSAVGWAEAAGPEAGAGAVPLPQIVLWMPSAPTHAASGGIVSSSCRGWGPSVEESGASTSATIASLVYLYCCLFLYIIKSCKMAYSSTVSNANASITIHARMYVCILCIHVCVYSSYVCTYICVCSPFYAGMHMYAMYVCICVYAYVCV